MGACADVSPHLWKHVEKPRQNDKERGKRKSTLSRSAPRKAHKVKEWRTGTWKCTFTRSVCSASRKKTKRLRHPCAHASLILCCCSNNSKKRKQKEQREKTSMLLQIFGTPTPQNETKQRQRMRKDNTATPTNPKYEGETIDGKKEAKTTQKNTKEGR